MYKPLHDSLTIKQSKVIGLGLFAKESIPQAMNLGSTHLRLACIDNQETIFRTPLGGFINHANDPNCVKVELHAGRNDPTCLTKKWNLVTLKDIKKGEELTLRYTFYNV